MGTRSESRQWTLLLTEDDMTRGNRWDCTAGGFAAILLWSTTVAVARSLSEALGPITAAASVYSVAAFTAYFSHRLGGRRHQGILQLPHRYLVGCGLLFTSYMLALFLAVGLAANRQQVLEIGLVNYLWPTLTLLLSLWLLHKRAKPAFYPGTFLALAGVFLVVSHRGPISWSSVTGNIAGNPAAYALALIASVCWALYSTLTRRWAAGRHEGAVAAFLTATAVVLLAGCPLVHEPREWTVRAMAEALYLGLATGTAYTLWDRAMRKGDVVLVAAASYFTPLFSTVISCVYLAVVPGASLWAGCAAIVLGSYVSWRCISNRAA